MSRRVAFPFLTLDDEAVDAEPWMVSLNSADPVPAEKFLADWDSASTLRVMRGISFDHARCSECLGLDPDDLSLAVSVQIGTGRGTMPRSLRSAGVWQVPPDAPELRIEFDIPGATLAHRLNLRTEVILASEPARPDSLSPRRPGSRIWQHQHDLSLEGDESRFPIMAASFSEVFKGKTMQGALWYLHWVPGDPYRDFGGAVRLYVNTDQTEFVERFNTGDPATVQTVLADVMSQIIERSLGAERDARVLADCPEGSVGNMAKIWMKRACPGMGVEQLQSMLEFRPGELRAALLAAAETGE